MRSSWFPLNVPPSFNLWVGLNLSNAYHKVSWFVFLLYVKGWIGEGRVRKNRVGKGKVGNGRVE